MIIENTHLGKINHVPLREFAPESAWNKECTEEYNSFGVPHLRLNPRFGFEFDGNVEFLNDLKRVESFRIAKLKDIDLTVLKNFPELNCLKLHRVILKKRTKLDLSIFSNLKYLDLDWVDRIINLDALTSLIKFEVWGLTKYKNLDLTKNKNIKSLVIHGARSVETVNLTGLNQINELILLGMPNLTEIIGLDSLQDIKDLFLDIDGSKKLDVELFKTFDKAIHVSFNGKRIISRGKLV